MTARGEFSFPAPWNTRGWRLTNASDCGGRDCVNGNIYDYWRNMSNSAGSNVMYIFVGLHQADGGAGPTLFELDKSTNKLTDMGPLPDLPDNLSNSTTATWFFSYSMPTKIYMPDGSKLLRYDVLTHGHETIFDSNDYKSGTIIRNPTASNDDEVFAAILEQSGGSSTLGCLVYDASDKKFTLFPGPTHQCAVDKSGRYVIVNNSDKNPACPQSTGKSTIVGDLSTGKEALLCDGDGGGGHFDTGYGWLIMADNHAQYHDTYRLWDLSQPLAQGARLASGAAQGAAVFNGPSWQVESPDHVSWENAQPASAEPIRDQYACGGAANTAIGPRANEIQCFLLDGSVPPEQKQTLVIAPSMTNLAAPGGGHTYNKYPKGNLDPTGQYYFFVSNLDSDRLDAFIVEVPYQKLTGSGGPPAPLTITINSPSPGAAVSGTVPVSAAVSDAADIARVQFQLDGADVGPSLNHSPYSIEWNTSTTPVGKHSLTAIAFKDSGGNVTSTPVKITVTDGSGGPAPLAISINSPSPGARVSGMVAVSASVSDAADIARVEFQLDGADIGPALNHPPYSIEWNASATTVGEHSLTAIAFKDSGGKVTSTPVSLMVTRGNDVTAPANHSGGGGFALWILCALSLLVLLRPWSKNRRRARNTP